MVRLLLSTQWRPVSQVTRQYSAASEPTKMMHGGRMWPSFFSPGCQRPGAHPGENQNTILSDSLVGLKNRRYLIDSCECEKTGSSASIPFPERINPIVDPEFPKLFHFGVGRKMDEAVDAPRNAQEDLQALGKSLRDLIDEELHTFGAIVIRGLPLRGKDERSDTTQSESSKVISTTYKYSELLSATGYNLTRYVGGVTMREEAEPMVYPASEEDPEVCMDLHQDNTYWPTPPAKLLFWYEQVAKVGGLNPLLSMHEYSKHIPKDIVDTFEEKGVRYENFYPDRSQNRFVSWQESFKTDDRAKVEENLRDGGFGWKWEEVNHSSDAGELPYQPGIKKYNLRKWIVLSPWKNHPQTGEKLWVNMIVANHASYFHAHPNYPDLLGVPFGGRGTREKDLGSFSDSGDLGEFQDSAGKSAEYPFNIKYGTGEEVPYPVIQTLRNLAWTHARGAKLEDGDLLIIDNFSVQHARLGYEPPRKMWLGISLD